MAMIKNRYNYLRPSVPRHHRERRGHFKHAPQSKHYKQKAKRTLSFQQMAKRLSKIKLHEDKHAKTEKNDRHTKQQKHHLGMASKNITGVGVGVVGALKPILHGHNPPP